MQWRRYIGMLVSALLIVAIIVVFTDPGNPLRREGKRIMLRDHATIDRITLTDSFDSTVLIRQGDAWLLFGEEAVNEAAVQNLIFAARRMQIASVMPEGALAGLPGARKIGFFHGDRLELGYTFYQVGNRSVIAAGAQDRHYYVTIPGYAGLNLDRVFSSSANHYREHILIDLLPSDISSIQVEKRGGNGYRFTQDPDGELSCTRIYPEYPVGMEMLDETSVRLLFSYFTSIMYEKRSGTGVDQLAAGEDSIPPLATLRVESHDGEIDSLKVYPYFEQPGGPAHMFKALLAYNEEPEALLINYIYIDVLMRDLSHYFARKE